MRRSKSSIIATRRLESGGKVFTVALRRPKRDADGTWECRFEIKGLGAKGKESGYGVDAFQALVTALEGIRVTLLRSGRNLTWVGGELGDSGFERVVTTAFGPQFSKRLNRVIDAEIKRYLPILKKQIRQRSKSASESSK